MSVPPLLSDHAAPGSNSYGAIRLLAALAVVVSHAWIVTGGAGAAQPL